MSEALHPAVELIVLSQNSVELHDSRTGLRITLEELATPLFEARSDRVPAGEFADFCAELGLTGKWASLSEVNARQTALRKKLHQGELDQRFTDVMSWATSQVRYYRDRATLYHVNGERPLNALGSFPLLTKADLRTHFDELLADDVSFPELLAADEVELVSTSGTTAEKVQAVADLELSRVPADFAKIWHLPAFARTPRTAVLTSPGCMGAAGCQVAELPRDKRTKKQHTLFIATTDDLFSLDRASIVAIVDELHDFAPDFMLVNPVYAHWIARRAVELGLKLPPVSLVLSSYQYLSEIQREGLQRLFGTPVRSFYSATELGGCQIGLECTAGRLHFREDHSVVEIVAGGRAARPGELGSVVVTTLSSRVMPLVRYEVGDLASPTEEDCDCPMQDWPSFVLHGRTSETLSIGGRLVTTRNFDGLLSAVGGIDFYCARQVGESSIRVDVVPSLTEPLSVGAIVAELREALTGAAVEVQAVSRLDPVPSLKYPLVIGPSAFR